MSDIVYHFELINIAVISDYKLRLEKALKTEKAEHAKSNASFDQVLQDEKSKNDKNAMEAKLRFNSLQQRYNLLQVICSFCSLPINLAQYLKLYLNLTNK